MLRLVEYEEYINQMLIKNFLLFSMNQEYIINKSLCDICEVSMKFVYNNKNINSYDCRCLKQITQIIKNKFYYETIYFIKVIKLIVRIYLK